MIRVPQIPWTLGISWTTFGSAVCVTIQGGEIVSGTRDAMEGRAGADAARHRSGGSDDERAARMINAG